MGQVFKVRRPDGKQCAETYTRVQANREIKWQIASGFPGPFTIEKSERSCNTERWGYSAPSRPGFKWPGAKLIEFGKRYMRGDSWRSLEDYFCTSGLVVGRKARELGFNKRIDDPRTFEKHRGRWTDREEDLINFMYDEETPIREISEIIPRGEGAITQRLRDSAASKSNRSKFGRFIVRPGRGRRGISPALEDN